MDIECLIQKGVFPFGVEIMPLDTQLQSDFISRTWVAFPKYKINLSRSTEHSIIIGDRISFWIHSRIFRYFGFNGCGSFLSTLMFLRKIDKLRIDLVHLHNLHDCYINFPLLFAFLKKKKRL